MSVPATPQNFRLVLATVEDQHHALLTVAADAATGATRYRWPHFFGANMNEPESRVIDTTASPVLTFGTTAPFIVAPGSTYTMGIQAGNADGWSVPNVQEFQVPPYIPQQPNPTAGLVALEIVQASIPGEQQQKGIFFSHAVTASNGKVATLNWQLDSGAYNDCLALSLADAIALGFADDGKINVSGVGGTVQLEETDLTVALGAQTFALKNVVIDPSLQVSLWGATLEIDDHIAIAWNPDTGRVGFFKTAGFIV